MTFEPHPRHYFKPDTLPFRLTPFRAKVTQIDALGVDAMLVVAFNRLFSQITADEFVDDVLVAGLGAKNVVVGYDFTFGRDRGGDTEFLAAKAPAKNFEFTTVQPVATADAVIYSSTVIRNYLTGGKPGHAAALLGRPFEIEGRVVKGDQIGRTIGFRTANLVLGDYIQSGVWNIRGTRRDRCWWRNQMARRGRQFRHAAHCRRHTPVVGAAYLRLQRRSLRTTHSRRFFIEYIRPEVHFDSIEKMTVQMENDCEVARRILKTRAAGAA